MLPFSTRPLCLSEISTPAGWLHNPWLGLARAALARLTFLLVLAAGKIFMRLDPCLDFI